MTMHIERGVTWSGNIHSGVGVEYKPADEGDVLLRTTKQAVEKIRSLEKKVKDLEQQAENRSSYHEDTVAEEVRRRKEFHAKNNELAHELNHQRILHLRARCAARWMTLIGIVASGLTCSLFTWWVVG